MLITRKNYDVTGLEHRKKRKKIPFAIRPSLPSLYHHGKKMREKKTVFVPEHRVE